jgi:two-component sensor histidine kinase
MLYRSGSIQDVDLADYLTNLAHQLFRALAPPSGVVLRLNLAPVRVDLDQAVPCGILGNELISNCLKHAFPDGAAGEVRIDLQPVDGGPQFRLQVADTGVGLPANFEERRAESLGLQLVDDLARQLRGTLDIRSEKGAIFSLVFVPRAPNAPARPEETQ